MNGSQVKGKNRKSFVSLLYQNVIAWIALLLISFLFILNAVCTTALMPIAREQVIFIRDSVPKQFIIVILFAAILLVIRKYTMGIKAQWISDEHIYKKIRIGLYCIHAFLCVSWVMAAALIPADDAVYCLQTVFDLYHGNYSQVFRPDSYLGLWPNQVGFVLFEYFIGKIFGYGNYYPIQLLNALLVPGIYWLMGDIGEDIGLGKGGKIVLQLLGILFLPTTLYCTHIYGTITGLFCALLAVRMELKYIRSARPAYIIGAFLTILLACMIKQNNLIFLIAMIVHLIAAAAERRKISMLFSCIALMLVFIFQGVIPGFVMRAGFGKAYDKLEEGGVSKLSYVAMGMQMGGAAPGWYNNYNLSTYVNEADCDPEIQSEIAMESIRESLNSFLNDPAYAAQFYLRKESSVWCDPTFGAVRETVQTKESVSDRPDQVLWFTETENGFVILDIFNVMQPVILAGAALWIVLCEQKRDGYSSGMLLLMTVIGVFIFHTLWEAKSIYVWPAYILLFPVSVSGWISLLEVIPLRVTPIKKEMLCSAALSISAVLASLSLFVVSALSGVIMTLWTDTAIIASARSSLRYEMQHRIDSGRYYIRPASEEQSSMTYEEGTGAVIRDGEYPMEVVRIGNRYIIRTIDDGISINANNDDIMENEIGRRCSENWQISDWGSGKMNISAGDDMYLIYKSEDGTARLERRRNDHETVDALWVFEEVHE